MKGKRYLGKRILAVALSVAMVLGCVDMPALAAEDGIDLAVTTAQDEAAAEMTDDAAAIEDPERDAFPDATCVPAFCISSNMP